MQQATRQIPHCVWQPCAGGAENSCDGGRGGGSIGGIGDDGCAGGSICGRWAAAGEASMTGSEKMTAAITRNRRTRMIL
jgi:hypothetical protein